MRKGAVSDACEVEEISLDHDLGLARPESERTGYDVLSWLEKELATGAWRFDVPEIRVHSANPVGWRRMEQAIESIRRLSGGGSQPPAQNRD
jgi:NAD+-processing family protein with receiver domain